MSKVPTRKPSGVVRKTRGTGLIKSRGGLFKYVSVGGKYTAEQFRNTRNPVVVHEPEDAGSDYELAIGLSSTELENLIRDAEAEGVDLEQLIVRRLSPDPTEGEKDRDLEALVAKVEQSIPEITSSFERISAVVQELKRQNDEFFAKKGD